MKRSACLIRQFEELPEEDKTLLSTELARTGLRSVCMPLMHAMINDHHVQTPTSHHPKFSKFDLLVGRFPWKIQEKGPKPPKFSRSALP